MRIMLFVFLFVYFESIRLGSCEKYQDIWNMRLKQ